MMLLMLILAVTLPLQQRPAVQVNQACAPQPLPPAIDMPGRLPSGSDVIEFAATPSLEYPGGAWVIRIVRRGKFEAGIEILRLQRQFDCNRYDIASRWQAPLRQDEYIALAKRITPLAVPNATTFIPPALDQDTEIVSDGTGLRLRLRSGDWQVTRSLNHFGAKGRLISAMFRDLAAKYVPASEMPREDWRAPASER